MQGRVSRWEVWRCGGGVGGDLCLCLCLVVFEVLHG